MCCDIRSASVSHFLTHRPVYCAQAERDCTDALARDPRSSKARLRRARARNELGRFAGAKEDAACVFELAPDDTQAAAELDKAVAALEKAAEREREKEVRRRGLPTAILADLSFGPVRETADLTAYRRHFVDSRSDDSLTAPPPG